MWWPSIFLFCSLKVVVREEWRERKSIWSSESSVRNPFSGFLYGPNLLLRSTKTLDIQAKPLIHVKINCLQSITFDSTMLSTVHFEWVIFFAGAHLKSVFYFGPSRINDGINLIRYMNQSRSYDIKHIPSNWRIKDATKKTCPKNAKRTFLLSGWLKKDKSRWPIINDAPASKSKSMAAHQFDRHPIAWSNINMLRIIYTQAP